MARCTVRAPDSACQKNSPSPKCYPETDAERDCLLRDAVIFRHLFRVRTAELSVPDFPQPFVLLPRKSSAEAVSALLQLRYLPPRYAGRQDQSAPARGRSHSCPCCRNIGLRTGAVCAAAHRLEAIASRSLLAYPGPSDLETTVSPNSAGGHRRATKFLFQFGENNEENHFGPTGPFDDVGFDSQCFRREDLL